jgi:hypothetical protein
LGIENWDLGLRDSELVIWNLELGNYGLGFDMSFGSRQKADSPFGKFGHLAVLFRYCHPERVKCDRSGQRPDKMGHSMNKALTGRNQTE